MLAWPGSDLVNVSAATFCATERAMPVAASGIVSLIHCRDCPVILAGAAIQMPDDFLADPYGRGVICLSCHTISPSLSDISPKKQLLVPVWQAAPV